jgi:hypothetical protein
MVMHAFTTNNESPRGTAMWLPLLVWSRLPAAAALKIAGSALVTRNAGVARQAFSPLAPGGQLFSMNRK